MLSGIGTVVALTQPGLTDWVLLAGPCSLASVVLLLKNWLKRFQKARKWAVVDGSNVMHWKDDVPSIETVREVTIALTKAGLTPGVVFDANVGYKISDRYMSDKYLASKLRLPRDRVMVAPKGTPADPLVLQAARDYQATIVTNDRFRDWADDYQDVLNDRKPIRGGYKDGMLWLSL